MLCMRRVVKILASGNSGVFHRIMFLADAGNVVANSSLVTWPAKGFCVYDDEPLGFTKRNGVGC